MTPLGDRIKRYEDVYNPKLTPRTPVIIRVDGRSFHTYTKGLEKPFSYLLQSAMVHAMTKTADDMQGFKLAYHQSDEVTFLITDTDKLTTQGWFNYELNKIVSMTASLFTAHFNKAMEDTDRGLATFDARAFNVPEDDVPNVFVWRQRDWMRNSVMMLARAHFSHKKLHGKKTPDMLEMLAEKEIHWDNLYNAEKYGTFYLRHGPFDYSQNKVNYYQVSSWISQEDEDSQDDERTHIGPWT